MSGRIDHAPRGFGRILDRAFELYRANFRTVVLSALIVVFPVAMLLGVTQVFSTRGFLEIFGTLLAGTPPTGPDPFTGQFTDQFTRIQMLSMVSNMITPVFLAARVYLVSCLLTLAPAMLQGHRPGVREFLRSGRSRFLWLLLVTFTVSVAASIGSFALLVGGLIVWARLSVAHVVTVVERAPLDRAFTRSWGLTRGRFWRTLGFAIALTAITFGLEAAVNSPAVIREIAAGVSDPGAILRELSPGWKTFEGALVATTTALVAPFTEFAWFFYYLDLRARREGMDIVADATALAQDRSA